MIRRLLIIVVALLFAYGGVAVAQTGNPDKIDPELQELMHQSRDASETFRVIIEMTEQYNDPNLERGTAMMTRAQRREYVVNELKRFSEQSQAEVVRYLGQQSTRGQVNVLHRFWIFNGVCCEATAESIGELSMRRDVRFVALDKEMHLIEPIEEIGDRSDPPEGVQWHVSKVRADEVWNSLGITGAGVLVAIIDTGVNYDHVDILNNMWNGGSQYPHHGWDFYNNDNDPKDDNGHGSHVAGIVAGNEVLYKIGIAPGATVMSLKTMGSDGSGYGESVQCQAIEFALDHGADVISMSLGTKGAGGIALYRTTFVNVMNAGVVASASAGNNAYPSDTLYKYLPPFNVGAPGNCPPPWHNPDQILQGGASAVICVGNTTDEDLRWRSSSMGPVTWASGQYIGDDFNDYPYNLTPPYSLNGLIRPDVSAPGTNIWSLVHNSNELFCTKTGTSMSTPCVAGVIALMLEANPNLTPAKIDEILETTAVPCENQTKKNNYYGAGRVDAFAAVSASIGYNITVDVMPSDGGTVEGCGTYVGGDICTLVATPNPGYIFRGWYLPANQLMPLYTTSTIAFPVWGHQHLIAKFTAVVPTTDVYNYYCWFDQDYSTVQTGSFQTTETFFALDASALSEGLHTLHVMLDDNGLSAPKTYLFLKAPVTLPVSSYNYHCWFDQDYSTVQTGTFGGGGYSVALDASELDEGIHALHVMLEGNELTSAKTYIFMKAPVTSPTSSYTYHCWFDQDYETVQTGTFGGEGYSFALDATELDEGIHTMHVMLEGNELTAAKTYLFLKAPVASPTSTYTYHCWFDNDYGTVQTGTFGGEGYSFALDASELEEGIHTMHVMLEGGELTAAKTYLFLKAPVASPTSTYTYHCWFDQDYTTVQTGTFGGEGYSFALDVDGLDNGLHFVNVMLEGNELSSAKRYLFCKKPIGGSGIYRWEYCLNGQWSDAVVTTLVPTVQTLDILTMLPVDHLPIRSEDFEFEPNGGQPEIYAKNTITFRFWDDENRFLDRSAVYVDATVHEPVVADWIQRNTTETVATPAANHIHWFKLDAEVGDSLAFKSDVYCTMELFAPSGARQFKVMNAASVAFNGICANESGIYYLAVHDVEGSYENVSVTYLFLREMTAVTALNAGWNWWTPTVWTDISTLQSTLSDYLIQIEVQDEMPTGNINPGKMLKIQTSVACALSLRGMPITAASITVNPGATWFGYIGEEAPITQALNGFPPSMDDKIISQDGGFAVYNGTEWKGTLTTLEPGKGYVYVSTAAWSKTIVFE